MAQDGREGSKRKRQEPDTERAPEEDEASNAHPALEWLKSILVAALLFLCIRTFLLQPLVIISGSMEENLLIGDFLIANRLAIGSRMIVIPIVEGTGSWRPTICIRWPSWAG